MYVDKNGFLSSPAGRGGVSTRTGGRIVDPVQQQMAAPPMKPFCEPPNTGCKDTNGTEPTQPNAFSPMDFLAGSAGFSFGNSTSPLAKDDGLGWPLGLNANDPSMEFMAYDGFMMDIGRSARFFEEDFLNSILFGLTPPPLATGDSRPVQGADAITSG